MAVKEKKFTQIFTLRTKKGSWGVLGLLTALMLLCSLLSNMITTNFCQISCTDITIDVRGYDKTFELWRPLNVKNDTKLPCVLLSHGGSESQGCMSLYAWEFARRGYVVININMDGAATSGMGNQDEAGNTFPKYTRSGTAGHLDILNYARSIVYVDPTRIGMMGHSQGNGTMGTALRLDNDYLTLNDRMYDILYKNYSVKVTAQQIAQQDADSLAKSVLSQQQYGEYLILKQQQQKIVSQYVKVARCAGANSKVTVAGISVTRDAQCNMMPSVGSHESKGTWAPETLTNYKNTVRSTGTPVINGIYSVPDTAKNPNATGTLLGNIFDISVTSSAAFKEAVKNNQARFLNIPITMHNGWLWSYAAVSTTIEYFTQCLGYNNGELSNSATKPISCKDMSVGYSSLVFTTLSWFFMIGMLMALASIIVKSPFFANCASERYAPKMPLKSKNMLIWVIVTTIVGFAGAFACSQEDLAFQTSIASMTRIMPWEPAQIRILFALVGTSVAGVAFFFLLNWLTKLTNKNKGGESVLATLKEVNLKAGWKRFFKTLLMGVMLFTVAYISACFINMAFDTRFMHVDGAYEPMVGYNFGRMFRYFIMFAPFCLIISTLNNMVTVKGVSDAVDTGINVVVTSLGMAIFMFIAYAVTYFPGPGAPQIWSLNSMLSMIFIIPYTNYIYRKMYKITGSVWAGAILVALILAWRSAGYISHRFMFVGNDESAMFWGIPWLSF